MQVLLRSHIDQYLWSGYQFAQAAPVTKINDEKKNIITMELAQNSIFFCPRDQLAETCPDRRRQLQTTRNAFTIPAREINSQKLATRSLVMTKNNNHKMRAGQ
jgi:hypothetical protein